MNASKSVRPIYERLRSLHFQTRRHSPRVCKCGNRTLFSVRRSHWTCISCWREERRSVRDLMDALFARLLFGPDKHCYELFTQEEIADLQNQWPGESAWVEVPDDPC